MSIDSRRSSINGGSGTTISSTTAMTAAGASRWVPRIGAGGAIVVVVITQASEHQLLDADQVCAHFGNSTEQLTRNHVADLALLVERPGERRIFDNRHGVLASDFANLCGNEIGALGDHDGGCGLVALVFERDGEMRRV